MAAWQALSAADSTEATSAFSAAIGTTPMLAPEAKRALLPGELEVAHGLAQRLRGAHRLIERAALEQDPELIAAQAREGIAPAHLRLEQRADLPEQRVARAVAAGVVDDLELVEIEAAERVGGLARLGALQRPLHAVLELAPVDEAGEHVVARVIGQRRLSSRASLTSWNTSTPPETAPEPSRMGDAVLST